MKTIININQQLYNYIISVSLREAAILRECRDITSKLPGSVMQISPDEGQFLGFLVRVMSAKKIVEVGTFTGYSSLCFALALPDDGKLITCDIDDKATAIATTLWKKIGVDHKIDLHLKPALETLQKLITNGESSCFDFAFIDADKRAMLDYYECCLTLLRPGGVMAIDNVLWSGDVINLDDNTAQTKTIRSLNEKIHADNRVDISLIGIGDGLTVVRKR